MRALEALFTPSSARPCSYPGIGRSQPTNPRVRAGGVLRGPMGLPTEAALVGAGAVPGAILRFGVSEIAKQHNVGPAAILALNVVGSFALGSLAGNGAAR